MKFFWGGDNVLLNWGSHRKTTLHQAEFGLFRGLCFFWRSWAAYHKLLHVICYLLDLVLRRGWPGPFPKLCCELALSFGAFPPPPVAYFTEQLLGGFWPLCLDQEHSSKRGKAEPSLLKLLAQEREPEKRESEPLDLPEPQFLLL